MSDIAQGGTAAPLPGIRLSAIRPKRLLIGAAAALIAAGALVYGYDWWTVGRFVETTDDAYVGGDVTSIAPHVAGFVSQVLVHDNQHVRAGEVLLRLDNRDFEAATDHAEAVVREEQATLANLTAQYALQRSLIRQAQADLAAKSAVASFAHSDDLRYQGLLRAVAISRQDVERAAATDGQARANLASSRAGVAAADQQLDVIDAQIAKARATVAQAEADLRTARLNLGYTELRAPVDGYVGNRAVRVGAYVATGAYLMSIIPAHGLWVDANFKEDQLARMKPGQRVTIVADVMPNRTFQGTVASLAPGTGAVFSVIPPENATGNFTKIVQRVPVRIVLDGIDATLGGLRPGLSITANVDTRPDNSK